MPYKDPKKRSDNNKKYRAARPGENAERTRKWREKNPEYTRRWNLMKRYGITLEQYETKLVEQQGVCAICGHTCDTGKSLGQDHDHETLINRGLLCQACNLGIGSFRHSPERLQKAIDYLKDWSCL